MQTPNLKYRYNFVMTSLKTWRVVIILFLNRKTSPPLKIVRELHSGGQIPIMDIPPSERCFLHRSQSYERRISTHPKPQESKENVPFT